MDGDPIELDTALDVCEHKHRRIVLATLVDQQQAVPINDLTNAIVKHNHHIPLAEASSEAVTEIQTALHDVHLPKLEEAELIEYDPKRQVVEPTAQFDQEESHLPVILALDSELPTVGSSALKDANHQTMTTNDSTRVNGTHVTGQERAVEAITKALETKELDEKDYQIREALQLLALKNE